MDFDNEIETTERNIAGNTLGIWTRKGEEC